ncbi:MAG: helix-turn-helix domain-containing protein [Clostridiales Family XIII bacterium]|jgi:excisionase family DNA binding protein|nr:helix-turn-helix domain-containing protein [Clostridiales Family XIII bacterium]
MINNKTFTVAEAAEYIGVCRETVYRMVRNGDLKAIRVGINGRKILFRKTSLDRWMDAQEGIVDNVIHLGAPIRRAL